SDPARLGFARATRVSQEAFDNWEVYPATSMLGHYSGPLEHTPFGRGCFEASAQPDGAGDLVRLCRQVNTGGDRSIDITLELTLGGVVQPMTTTRVPYNQIQGETVGDMLRVALARNAGTTIAAVYTANEINPDGTPAWNMLGVYIFPSDLLYQGLYQEED